MSPNRKRDPASTQDEGLRIARLLADAGWLQVADRILSGICHDLNGRVSSLDGLIHLLTLDGGEGTPVVPYLEAEVTKLESAVRLLRLIPGDLAADPEPLPAEELARGVASLESKHRGHEALNVRLAVDAGVPPVLVNRVRVGRALTLVAARVAQAAVEAGERDVEISLAGDHHEVRLTVGIQAADPPPARGSDPTTEAAVKALSSVLAADGATLEYPEAGPAVVKLPSLTRSRTEGC